jgi:hypothetical protein
MRVPAALALILAVTAPALGQTTDFQQVLSGKQWPQTLKLKELDGDWRHVTISAAEGAKGGLGDMMSQLMPLMMMGDKNKGKDDPAAAMLGLSFISALFGGGGGEGPEPVYYTKGQAVTVGGQTFLIAYRYQKPAVNFMQVAADAEKNGKQPDPGQLAEEGKMTPESSLSLCLLNVQRIGALHNIRPFDMNQEIAESAQAGGGLMEMMAKEAAKDNQAKPAPAPAASQPGAKKPAARSKPMPRRDEH